MRLNKFISLCGVASRRGADELIKALKVSVNGKVVEDLGRQVENSDIVEVEGKRLFPPKKTTVLAFHKPAGCVCTLSSWMASNTFLMKSESIPQRAPCAPRLSRISL